MKRMLITEIGLSIVAVIAVAGCTNRPTTLGPDPGLAYTMAHDQQLLNPEAGKNLEPVQGLEDGPAAKNILERYRSSFERPEEYRTKVVAPSVVGQGIQSSGASGS